MACDSLGNKDKCGCCCRLATGIKMIGVWLIIECVLHPFTFGADHPLNATILLFTQISLMVNAAMFIWSWRKKESVIARIYWFNSFMVDFALNIASFLIITIYYQVSSSLRNNHTNDCEVWTEEGDVDVLNTECIDHLELVYSTTNIVYVGGFIALRLWFANNIRDWRDKFFRKYDAT